MIKISSSYLNEFYNVHYKPSIDDNDIKNVIEYIVPKIV